MSVKDEFDKLTEHFGDMVDQMLSRNYFRYAAPDAWNPSVNVYELPDAYVVCVDLAGMDREQIDVQVDGRTLHIRGNRPNPVVPDSAETTCVQMMEIDTGRFHRKLLMPEAVDAERVVANYRNGYLWIRLPRDGLRRPQRR